MRAPHSARSISAAERRSVRAARLLHEGLSRRTFLGGAAAGAGLVLGAGALRSAPAFGASCTGQANPIPGGLEIPGAGFFHLNLPGPGVEVSTITDLDGSVGVAQVQGRWESTGIADNKERFYEVDIRFMKGLFVDTGGCRTRGAFGFV